MRRSDTIKAVLHGIYRANKKYEEWSGGDWITDAGVEGFVVGQIADSIIKSCKRHQSKIFTSIETPFRTVRETTGVSTARGRRKGFEQGSPRVDITLYNAQNAAIGAIEVKRGWYGGNGIADMQRIEHLVDQYGLGNGGTLRFGLFATFITTNLDRQGYDLSAWRGVIADAAKGSLKPESLSRTKFYPGPIYQYPTKYRHDGDMWEAQPFCVEIVAPPARKHTKC